MCEPLYCRHHVRCYVFLYVFQYRSSCLYVLPKFHLLCCSLVFSIFSSVFRFHISLRDYTLLLYTKGGAFIGSPQYLSLNKKIKGLRRIVILMVSWDILNRSTVLSNLFFLFASKTAWIILKTPPDPKEMNCDETSLFCI